MAEQLCKEPRTPEVQLRWELGWELGYQSKGTLFRSSDYIYISGSDIDR